MPSETNIVVMGAKGRMGQMILESASANANIRVVGAVEAPGSPAVGQAIEVRAGTLNISDNLEEVLSENSVVIDFTAPEATLEHLKISGKQKAKMVIGTTGFSPQQTGSIQEAAKSMAVVMAPNMSLGVNLSFKISEMVAKVLQSDFDVEIIEAHHNQKKDAPSGTALGLAQAVARGHESDLSLVASYGREGLTGARKKGEIGIHAVRGGDIVGDHTVLFAGDGERIEIRHVAHSRSTFANGAVKAAEFLSSKDSGLFSMFDVLGLQ